MRRSTTSNDGWFWTNLRIYSPYRTMATVAAAATFTVGCGREGGAARSLEQVNYGSAAVGSAPPSSNEQISTAAAELQKWLKDSRSAKDLRAVEQVGRRLSEDIRGFETGLAADEHKLSGLDLKSAHARVKRVRERVNASRRDFDLKLQRLTHTSGAANAERRSLRRAIDALVPPAPHQPLSSGLAFKDTEPMRQTVPLSASITPAYAAPNSSDSFSTLPREASPEDLITAAETRLTPAIRSLAESLNGDPVKIYNYVQNEIKYEPYFGVRKGAAGTLAEKSGSDADQAALMISLLRVSNIHARFVQGTAEFTPTQVRNWLGTPSASSAQLADMLSSGGIPTSQVRSDGKIDKLRVVHVWAAAFVADGSYRGIDETLGGKRWLPLDPSVKTSIVVNELEDSDLTAREIADVTQAFEGGAHQSADTGGYTFATGASEAQLVALARRSSNHASSASDSALSIDGVAIEQQRLPYLPSTLPFRTVIVSTESHSLPTSMLARVSIAVSGSTPSGNIERIPEDADGIEQTVPTMDLAGHRLTVAYTPTTSEDTELVDAYHGLFGAPAPGVTLTPVLRLDGRVIAAAPQGAGLGYTQRLRLTYISPGFAPDRVDNPLTVGGLTALSVNVGTKSASAVRARASQLDAIADSATPENAGSERRLGEMLAVAGDLYFLRNDLFNAGLAAKAEVHAQRAVSGALVQLGLRATLIAGFPVAVDADGVEMDVDEDVQAVNPLGTNVDTKAYMRASASYASGSEGAALEMAFGRKGGLSTTRVLAEAASQGIPILSVTASNLETMRSSLAVGPAVTAQIAAAVSAGAQVTVPARTLTLDGWTGVAYIIEQGGSLDYRITGGSSGGILKLAGRLSGAYAFYLVEEFLVKLWDRGYENAVACGLALFLNYTAFGIDALIFLILGGAILAPLLVVLGILLIVVLFRIINEIALESTEAECFGGG